MAVYTISVFSLMFKQWMKENETIDPFSANIMDLKLDLFFSELANTINHFSIRNMYSFKRKGDGHITHPIEALYEGWYINQLSYSV